MRLSRVIAGVVVTCIMYVPEMMVGGLYVDLIRPPPSVCTWSIETVLRLNRSLLAAQVIVNVIYRVFLQSIVSWY